MPAAGARATALSATRPESLKAPTPAATPRAAAKPSAAAKVDKTSNAEEVEWETF
jgi:hypothetical protein